MTLIRFCLICLFFTSCKTFADIHNQISINRKKDQTVSIDSIRYFKAVQIRLKANDFIDTVIKLTLHNGDYIFSKDSLHGWLKFTADISAKEFCILTEAKPKAVTDTSLTVRLKYMFFSKKKRTNSSSYFKIDNFQLAHSFLKSFTTTSKDYNKIFPK